MTSWPEPERKREPARLPRAPRTPGQSRFHIPVEDRWLWFGMGLSVLLVVVFFGFWTNWFGFTAPPPSDGDSASAAGGFTHSVVGDLVVVGLLGALAATVAWWISRGLRDDAPKVSDLSEDEQIRRREVGALLREVVPPVSEEEARESLHPDWLDDAVRRAEERSQGRPESDDPGPTD